MDGLHFELQGLRFSPWKGRQGELGRDGVKRRVMGDVVRVVRL